jgi:Integrase core domain
MSVFGAIVLQKSLNAGGDFFGWNLNKRELQIKVTRDRRSPWQNPYVERLIGTLRRECLDHILIFGERHLRRVLTLYSLYYNETRTHLGLAKDAPLRRPVQRSGTIVTTPILSGLHHCYAGYDFREGQELPRHRNPIKPARDHDARTGVTDATRGAHRAHALWPRHEYKPWRLASTSLRKTISERFPAAKFGKQSGLRQTRLGKPAQQIELEGGVARKVIKQVRDLFFTVALSLCVVGLIVLALASILGSVRDDWKIKKPLWDQFTDDCAWSITPVPRYTSLLTVIDHAGPERRVVGQFE